MELHGVYAPPGTLMGWHLGEQRHLTADVCDTNDLEARRLPLRWSTPDELTAVNVEQEDPRSVAEHYAITRKQTVYGMARWPLSKMPKHKTGAHLSTVSAGAMLREHNPAVAEQVYGGVRPKHVSRPAKLEIVQSIPDRGGKHRHGN